MAGKLYDIVRYLGMVVICVLLAGCGGDRLYITRDGAAALDRRHGGAGRRVEHFRITRERMAVIRRGLERLRAHPPREYADDPDRVAYTLWASGHTYRAQPGRMDRRERPLFRALEGVINGQARE